MAESVHRDPPQTWHGSLVDALGFACSPAVCWLPPGARVRDCINVCWFKLRQKSQKSSKDLAASSFCNISQCVSRLPCSETCSPCFTSSSVVYSYAHDTVITGACQLRGMGHSRASMPMGSFDDGTCRNLAGDSFSVPIASLLTTACALNPFASWW